MPSPQQCPDRERLTAFLKGVLSADQESALVAHLDACALCRELVDAEISTIDFARGLKPRVGPDESPPGTALRRVLDAMKHDPDSADSPGLERSAIADASFGSVASGRDDRLTAVERSILGPTDDPQSLGRLGPYEILGLVGRGGMGTVLKANDSALNRVVAIKILSPVVAADPMARHRFTRGARAAAAICHENVVNIHAVDEAGAVPYLVMQFIGGRSLQERLSVDGPLGLKEILRIGMQTASGLAAAHAQGIIHRDIKPANLLLENGIERVKITDFGLARSVADATLSEMGTVSGTPGYMSPEQARGEQADHRSDLFSLGSVLYALCTGVAPFRAESPVAVLRKVIDEEPPLIPTLNDEIPGWLVAIIATLMAKDPAQRYQSATEVSELLTGHLADLQQPVRRRYRAPENIRRALGFVPLSSRHRHKTARRIPLAAFAACAFLLVAALVVFFEPLLRKRPSNAPAPSGIPADHVTSRQPDPVLAELDQAIAQAPNDAEAFARRARVFAARKERRAAIADFSRALELDPARVERYYDRGWAYCAIQDWNRAIADFDAAIRLKPSDPWPRHSRAWARRGKRDFKAALADNNEAVRLAPQSAGFYRERGITYIELRDWDPAIADLNKSVKLDPTDSQAWAHLGRAHAANGNGPRALDCFNEAIRLNPSDPSLYGERGNVKLDQRDWEGTIADFTTVQRFKPGDCIALLSLARAYEGKGDANRGLECLHEAVRLNPREPTAYFERGQRYVWRHQWDLAIADFNKADQLKPGTHLGAGALAQAYRGMGDMTRSLAVCNAAIRYDPHNGWARNERGCTYIDLGDWDRAIADFDVSLRDNPNDAWGYASRGRAYRGKGDLDHSLADLTEAIRISPRTPNFYFQRGLTQSARGDSDRAIADFSEAVRLNHFDSRFIAARGREYNHKAEYAKAVADLDEAFRTGDRDPDDYEARAEALDKLGKAQEAKADRERAAVLRPTTKKKPTP
jgi:serine/threonine protein kinase/Flp pilus assembly protein TadD